MDKSAKTKCFLDYDSQIKKLEDKNLIIGDKNQAIEILKQKSYYSLITGYKDVFKEKNTGNYKENIYFAHIDTLYNIDEALRELYLRYILKIERHIKSLYSYAFTQRFGEDQNKYLNVNNYKYNFYQDEINESISILKNIIDKQSDKYAYIEHYKVNYNNVPLWVIINTLTLGNVSKLYEYSIDSIKSKISKEFKGIYSGQMESILNIISKFRNVCAHNERLFNYKVNKKSLKNLPIHKEIGNNIGKNDLFAVTLVFKYLLDNKEYETFKKVCFNILDQLSKVGKDQQTEIFKQMGFPDNWREIIDM